jgi:DNA-binding protein HU-beta
MRHLQSPGFMLWAAAIPVFNGSVRMTLDELNSSVAAATGMTKAGAARAVAATLDGIQAALRQGSKVSLTGFGVFEVAHRPARQGRNPQTGKTIAIAASNAVRFKPGKGLRDAVNAS